MSILEIVKLPSAILRQKTQPVTGFDAALQQLIDDMIETMRAAPGVGLAAPQIGKSISLAVIETLADIDEDGNEIPGTRDLYVLANPEIIWTSKEMVDGIEGCLSIPGYLGEVDRYTSVRVKAQDRYGRNVRYRVHGWDARIFQHEIDHLNGVLYIDRLTAAENFWTDEEFREKFYGEEGGEAVKTAVAD